MTDPTRIPTPWHLPAEWIAERDELAAIRRQYEPCPGGDDCPLHPLVDMDSPAGAGESVEAFRG